MSTSSLPPTPSPPSRGAVHPLLAAGAPRPLLDARKRQLSVRSLRRLSAELGLYPAPNRLAALLGIRLVWRTDFDENEAGFENPQIGRYDWDGDARARHLNMLLAVVGVFLRRERVAHNASDIWLVALDFAVPREASETDLAEMIAEQPHCPETLIRQVLALRAATDR